MYAIETRGTSYLNRYLLCEIIHQITGKYSTLNSELCQPRSGVARWRKVEGHNFSPRSEKQKKKKKKKKNEKNVA